MKVLIWNINGAKGNIGASRGGKIVESINGMGVDLALLQEVPRIEDFAELERLRDGGFAYQFRPQEFTPDTNKGYSSFIASREPADSIETPAGWEKPGDFCVVKIRGIQYASCHIPNGSGNNKSDKETKQRHLGVAVEWLNARPNRFLGGDFNEPWAFKDGRAISWASDGPRFDPWREAVDQLFSEPRTQHLCTSLHGPGEPESVRFSGRRPPNSCWYDHALWNGPSLSFTARYHHEWNHVNRLSDHSPLIIEF